MNKWLNAHDWVKTGAEQFSRSVIDRRMSENAIMATLQIFDVCQMSSSDKDWTKIAHEYGNTLNKKGVDTLTFRHVGRCPRQNFKDKVGVGGPICLRFSWRRSDWWSRQDRFF